ncbi:MAG: ABC transporter ATP-binding protein [Candidatus Riflebacteria bacterium]|nr:ABC transporter ATP-binding protein [Candidatus Riflebacteria bacterium]
MDRGRRAPDAPPPPECALELRGIQKRFGQFRALAAASLSLWKGEIHAVVGENGAGKSTLMNVATGIYQPDGGEVLVNGIPVRLSSPRRARELGIGMVHPHFLLARRHTVLDNVLLGLPGVPVLPDRKALGERIRGLAGRYGLPVDPDAFVWQLSVGEQQRVEIVKTLIHDARILILDEPTAVLTPSEAGELFGVLRRLKADGTSIVFISHKLEELLEISDRISIMRCGETVGTVTTRSTTTGELARLMVGRDVVLDQTPGAPAARGTARPLLTVSGLSAINDRGVPALKDVSFDLWPGEIVAIAGISGNGQTELTEILYGSRAPVSGSFRLGCDAAPVTMSPRRAIGSGISFIPADRRRTGTAPGLSITDNLLLKSYREPPYCRAGFLDRRAMHDHAAELVDTYEIRCACLDQPAGTLSGGNLQKVIIARELARSPSILIAVCPCRGLDVGSIETVRRILLAARDRGTGVILVSEDLDEVFCLGDRIAVLCGGALVGPFPAGEVDRVSVGLMMAGARCGKEGTDASRPA